MTLREKQQIMELERLRLEVVNLKVENEKLRNHADHVEEESGWRDCMALQAEVERLKSNSDALQVKYEKLATCWNNVADIIRRYVTVGVGSCYVLDGIPKLIGEHIVLQAEVERLKAQLGSEQCDAAYWKDFAYNSEQKLKAQPTAAEERAAIVAWLRSDKRWQSGFPSHYASCIEAGEHWPTEGAKCRHCLRPLQAHEQDFCDGCSQLEGETP